jgi:hypothetical protein
MFYRVRMSDMLLLYFLLSVVTIPEADVRSGSRLNSRPRVENEA